MNAEEQTKEKMRATLLETMKEIQQMTKDVYWYDSAMKQLFGTEELSKIGAARLTVIQEHIDWLVDTYETKLLQQDSKEE